MTRLYYLAHPVSGDVVANCSRAARWLRALMRALPDDTVIAPWLAALVAGNDDADPSQREAGLLDCERVVERCDGLIACGERWSTGMLRELGAARCRGLPVADLTGLGDPFALDLSRVDLARIVAERTVGGSPTAHTAHDQHREIVGALMARARHNAAQRDELAACVADLLEIQRATGGYMSHEDQVTLRRAMRVLGEVRT